MISSEEMHKELAVASGLLSSLFRQTPKLKCSSKITCTNNAGAIKITGCFFWLAWRLGRFREHTLSLSALSSIVDTLTDFL